MVAPLTTHSRASCRTHCESLGGSWPPMPLRRVECVGAGFKHISYFIPKVIKWNLSNVGLPVVLLLHLASRPPKQHCVLTCTRSFLLTPPFQCTLHSALHSGCREAQAGYYMLQAELQFKRIRSGAAELGLGLFTDMCSDLLHQYMNVLYRGDMEVCSCQHAADHLATLCCHVVAQQSQWLPLNKDHKHMCTSAGC